MSLRHNYLLMEVCAMANKNLVFEDFTGGVRSSSDKSKLKINEAEDSANFIVNGTGNLVRRFGCTKLMDESATSPTKAVTMLKNFKKSDGTKEVVVAYDGVIKKLNMTTGAVTNLPTTVSGQSATGIYGAEIYDDKLYMCNGIDNMWKYDGTTNTTIVLTNVAASTFRTNVFSFKDRKMFAVDYGTPTLLHRSKTDGGTAADIYTFNYTGGTVLENSGTTRVKEGGEPLTALAVLDNLYVYSKNQVFTTKYIDDGTGTGAVLFALDNVGRSVGAVTDQSTIEIGNAIVFVDPVDKQIAQLGQRSTYPGVFVSGVSDKIMNKMQEEFDFSTAKGVYFRRLVLIACKKNSSSPCNDIVIVEDLETKSIYFITGWFVNCWMEYDGSLYFGSALAPMVYKAFDSNGDNGSIISAFHNFKLEYFGDPAAQKDMDYLHIQGTIDEQVQATVRIEFNDNQNSIEKTIDGSNSDYIISSGSMGMLGTDPLGEQQLGGISQESDRVFSVWVRVKAQKFQGMQIKISTNTGIGRFSIRSMEPINVRVVTEEPPSIRKI